MKLITKAFFTFISTFAISGIVNAAWIHEFNVELNPTTAKVWEALDLTIEAVDKNWVTVSDYTDTILIFSESDPEAELPSALQENTYTFTDADQWKIKFENSVKFTESWLQDIYIYDLNDDTVFWVWEVQIEANKVVSEDKEINIVSPENWLTIWKNSLIVSWTTQKNHQIKIVVNWSDEFETISNSDWIFEQEVTWLENGKNTFKAQILDADMKIIWESNEVDINIELSNLYIKSVKTTPKEVDAESAYELEIITTAWLEQVSAIVNDVVKVLDETEDWIYKAKLYWPKEAWEYKIDINLKDELGNEKTELWVTSIKVNQVELKAANQETENNQDVITTTNVVEEDKMQITWLKLVELKTKSVLTWDKIDEAESYNVYKKSENWNLELVENVLEPKFEVDIKWDNIKYDYFAVKALSKTESGELYEWSLSDATKVKTGPELLILLILSLIIGWMFVFLKQNRA